jgi:fatty-acyl-CoA synthase
MYAGATMVLMPRWDRELAGRLISRWQVTAWTNIPTMVIDLLASPNFASFDLSSLKSISGGGAAMPQAVAQRLFDVYGLRYAEGYGLTETAAPSHRTRWSTPAAVPGHPLHEHRRARGRPRHAEGSAAGRDRRDRGVRPAGVQRLLEAPRSHGRGVLRAGGPALFPHRRPGRVDEDGYFFITDRLKRMINASGFKVWPAEVEALMFKHPAIQEACVIGTKDAYRGESVKAVVVLRAGHQGA